jgi:uncharacterized repeat protein (TIGR04076 family)
MAHFKDGPPDEFWKGFKEHMKYTDQDMEYLKNDPRRTKWAPKMASPDIQESTLVIEVIESHGCANGMKVGDKLYFQGCGLLDTKRSDNWCASAFNHISKVSNVCHNLILHGIDPNDMYNDCQSCSDCGTKYGWGNVIMRSSIIREPKNPENKIK